MPDWIFNVCWVLAGAGSIVALFVGVSIKRAFIISDLRMRIIDLEDALLAAKPSQEEDDEKG